MRSPRKRIPYESSAPASPQGGLKPVARAQVLPGGDARPYMAVSDGFVYARNERTLVCLDLRR